MKKLSSKHPAVVWAGESGRELNEEQWERITADELKKLKKGDRDIQQDMKGAPWKVKIARRLRKETTASNPWIAKRLRMGHPNRVSNLLNETKY